MVAWVVNDMSNVAGSLTSKVNRACCWAAVQAKLQLPVGLGTAATKPRSSQVPRLRLISQAVTENGRHRDKGSTVAYFCSSCRSVMGPHFKKIASTVLAAWA